MARLPLEGIRVVDLSVVWAGPFATQMLADWGAEVIVAESRHFFVPWTRAPFWPPPTKEQIKSMRVDGYYLYGYPDGEPGDKPHERYCGFNSFHRNKLGMTLEISKPRGKEILGKLIKVSDIVIENRPPSHTERWGITYDWMKQIKPDIIFIRCNAYGCSGPYREFTSFGPMIDYMTGHAFVRCCPGLTPDKGVAYNHYTDSVGGRTLFLSILMALEYRHRTGKGQVIDIAQSETLITLLPEAMMDYTMNHRVQEPLGNHHPVYAPCDVFRCRGEDSWIAITVTSDEEWQGLCHAMGNPDWTKEEKFADPLKRYDNQEELNHFIEEWTKEYDHYELMHLLQKEGVPAGALLDEAELTNDPHLKERGWLQEQEVKYCGTHLYPTFMWKMSKTPNKLRKPPIRLGEDNEHVYKEIIGVSDEEYSELERTGHIGNTPEYGMPFEG